MSPPFPSKVPEDPSLFWGMFYAQSLKEASFAAVILTNLMKVLQRDNISGKCRIYISLKEEMESFWPIKLCHMHVELKFD